MITWRSLGILKQKSSGNCIKGTIDFVLVLLVRDVGFICTDPIPKTLMLNNTNLSPGAVIVQIHESERPIGLLGVQKRLRKPRSKPDVRSTSAPSPGPFDGVVDALADIPESSSILS